MKKLVVARSVVNNPSSPGHSSLPGWAYRIFFTDYPGKWYAAAETGDLHNPGKMPTGSVYLDGWNGSYHDAWYDASIVLAWGSSPSRARKRLKRALAHVSQFEKKDKCTARFEARQQVREGD